MSDRILQFLAGTARRSDLAIALMMLVAVVMMLVPLPTTLVDVLIVANITMSILILLAAIYIVHPLELSSLPSLILIATLFRLAITITTTRLILLQADAGTLVTAFGDFVVGGSIVVGLVVFLIITIAQFVVIAKGAERVAEVAARFVLDALPGKQMSIDAELRNGDIDQAEARRLRRQLERESQLFGAMDGAMKFVKGDVIAGIVIILVNLIGGFAVGTLQHGMSLSQAAARYSLLTVGDGLVAQIPALMVSVAAGTVITRVAGTEGHGDLGRQITTQLGRDPRVMALAAAIVAGLGLVPGFPSVVFLAFGAALAAAAFGLHRSRTRDEEGENEIPDASPEQPSGAAALPADASGRTAVLSQRVQVRLGQGLAEGLETDVGQRMERIRRHLQDDLGVDIPPIGIVVDETLDLRRLRVDLDGAPILDRDIPAGCLLITQDCAHLDLLGIAYREGAAVAAQRKGLWVEDHHADALAQAGLTFHTAVDVIDLWSAEVLRLYAGHFMGLPETRRLLSQAEAENAELAKQAQEVVPAHRIAEVLRRLVAEDVPVRNLRLILEALIEWGEREKDPVLLAEHVRAALKRQISFRVADRNHIIAAYVLQPSAEDMLRSAVQATSSGVFINVSDEEARAIARQIEQAPAGPAADTPPVVLAAADVRRHVRSLLLHTGVHLPVLSYQDIAPEFNVQPLATITALQDRQKPRRPTAPALPAAGNSTQPRMTS